MAYCRILLPFERSFLYLCLLLLAIRIIGSLEWRMEHDTPLLHYAGFLIDDCDRVPYRDFFETSMPGTFAFHYAIGSLLGYSDLAFRFVDLFLLGTLFASTIVFLRRFGWRVAIWGATLIALLYLYIGQPLSLQRDYIGIIPIAFALLAIPRRAGTHVGWQRFAFVGFLFGTSVLIKPHLAVALPIVLGTLLAFRWGFHIGTRRDLLFCLGTSLTALAIAPAIAMIWLAAHSALGPFLDIMFNYLPLHSAMTGFQEAVTPQRRIFYLIENTLRFGGLGPMLLAALFGWYRLLTTQDAGDAQQASGACLILSMILYVVYVTLAGKFWIYHFMPFAYFACLSAAMCLFAWPRVNGEDCTTQLSTSVRETLPLLILLLASTLTIHFPEYSYSAVRDLMDGPEAHAPRGGRVDEIAIWLEQRLRAGDTVQALDWTGGAIHAMLIAEAPLATRFMYDYHFYHHVSNPFIRSLRGEFMAQLARAHPRFIIEVQINKPRVWGVDTTRSFPELESFVARNYRVAFQGDGYRIHELECKPELKEAGG